jgi:hypothetical protein
VVDYLLVVYVVMVIVVVIVLDNTCLAFVLVVTFVVVSNVAIHPISGSSLPIVFNYQSWFVVVVDLDNLHFVAIVVADLRMVEYTDHNLVVERYYMPVDCIVLVVEEVDLHRLVGSETVNLVVVW